MLDDDVRSLTDRFKELPLIREALESLHQDLPTHLTYHSYAHTEDVLREAMLFGVTDGLSERQLELLAIAAAYHDVGFTKSSVANESISAQMAADAMRRADSYSEDEIQLVHQMIIDTTLHETESGLQQIPTTDLSRYLLDADLSNLGREDFRAKGELQRQELGAEENAFRERSLALITGHRWFTPAARTLRQKTKDTNVELLKRKSPSVL